MPLRARPVCAGIARPRPPGHCSDQPSPPGPLGADQSNFPLPGQSGRDPTPRKLIAVVGDLTHRHLSRLSDMEQPLRTIHHWAIYRDAETYRPFRFRRLHVADRRSREKNSLYRRFPAAWPKVRFVDRMMGKPPGDIDVLVMEGTNLGSDKPVKTEKGARVRLHRVVQSYEGPCLHFLVWPEHRPYSYHLPGREEYWADARDRPVYRRRSRPDLGRDPSPPRGLPEPEGRRHKQTSVEITEKWPWGFHRADGKGRARHLREELEGGREVIMLRSGLIRL